jgi:SAM-dependent methyltransferase
MKKYLNQIARKIKSGVKYHKNKQLLSIQDKDAWEGMCSIGGYQGRFRKNHKSIREAYSCPQCNASLRYRHQAQIILDIFGSSTQTIFAQLPDDPGFRNLRIYEPGIIRPFRKYLKKLKGYQQSYFWPGVKPGDTYKGIRCENLENITFSDNCFDLVITSDIFEHIRKPFKAFKQIHRILKPGGWHIFTIPMAWPLPEQTQYRVDTSGETDILIKEPVYHGSPMDKKGSLVYTDFGLDIITGLEKTGFKTGYKGIEYNLTFFSQKQK